MPDDPDLAHRWERALAAISAREAAERGVTEATSVSGRANQLMANFGPMSVVLTGPAAEVTDEVGLFEIVDRWLVFDRGVDALLDRDHAYIADWKSRLPAVVARWQACADLVAADVARTTGLGGSWRVEVREYEDGHLARLRRMRERAAGEVPFATSVRFAHDPEPTPEPVPLLLPEVWLVAPGLTEMPLWAGGVIDLDDGTPEIAAKVQDEVIDAVWGAWPVCPGHGHPAAVVGAAWRCPNGLGRVAPIGQLGLPDGG